MFSRDARDAGFYPILATHDDRLQAYALERAAAAGWRADEYEFEMLLGVRSDVAEDLARRGERVRLYLPFGTGLGALPCAGSEESAKHIASFSRAFRVQRPKGR